MSDKSYTFDFQEELKKLPKAPGVYLFLGIMGEILYVGKAISLRSRVRSYFADAGFICPKIYGIRENAKSFEYIVTDNQTEALILECNLIKEHQPKYNVKLKDDKSYPYIKVTTDEDFPKIFSTRDFSQKDISNGAKYFGPYTSSSAVKETIDQILKIWPLKRSSKKVVDGQANGRPCLNYHIKMCPGPCGMHITKEEYSQSVAQVLEFLAGKHDDVFKSLQKQMLEASSELRFEEAASFRDKIAAVKRLKERQKVDKISKGDQDIIAFAINEDEALFQVFFIRDGKMTGREHFMVYGVSNNSQKEIMTQFVTQFYSGTPFTPKELILQVGIEDEETVKAWLSTQKGQAVHIIVPQKGEKHNLVKMAHNNAIIQLEQFGKHIKSQEARTTGALEEIQAALGFDAPIHRIEAYDISNIQGFENVGSMVVFEGGKAKRADFRKFKIKSIQGQANDYASMQEVIHRRLKRYQANDAKFARLPDVIFIDGGKGHMAAVAEVLKHMDISIPLCGMVKDDKHKTRALLYNGQEITMPKTSEGFRLITRIQDEVHRFALEYHRNLRSKAAVKSILDQIPGVGDARRKALLLRFGSVEGIKAASVDDLAATPKMNKKIAETIHAFLNPSK
ncbi:MAG: excinuclease ABC subunit UvrC [Defluviitaleaceae bacterium]|nr:excinuclease ABC subunit UvrC [Defluviitaleaceae bacterium]